MAEKVREIRGGRKAAGSRPACSSRWGVGDSGESKSGDQSGLITLEWIILVASITGIVTMALLVGWDALWDRGDELADEGGSGHQLSARRAAAEVDSGRACSLLNDLYDDSFTWVADDPTDHANSDCTCEIDSDADETEVCAPKRVENAAITVRLAKGGNARTIEASTLFFSENSAENSADLTYTVSIPNTNIIQTSIDRETGSLTITPSTGGTAGNKTETATVTLTDSNTSTDTVDVTVKVIDECTPEGVESPVNIGDFEGDATDVFAVGNSKVVFLRDHLKTGFDSSGDLDPGTAILDPTNASATAVYNEWIELSNPPLSQTTRFGQTRYSERYPILVISALRAGTNKLTVEGTYCGSGTDSFSLPIYIAVGQLVTPIGEQSAASPLTINLSTLFSSSLTSPTYAAPEVTCHGHSNVPTVAENSGELTITKAAGATSTDRCTIKVTATDNEVQLHTKFDVTF